MSKWGIGDVTKVVELDVTGGSRIVVNTCLGNGKENRDIPHWNSKLSCSKSSAQARGASTASSNCANMAQLTQFAGISSWNPLALAGPCSKNRTMLPGKHTA